jgi:hypothetical protein
MTTALIALFLVALVGGIISRAGERFLDWVLPPGANFRLAAFLARLAVRLARSDRVRNEALDVLANVLARDEAANPVATVLPVVLRSATKGQLGPAIQALSPFFLFWLVADSSLEFFFSYRTADFLAMCASPFMAAALVVPARKVEPRINGLPWRMTVNSVYVGLAAHQAALWYSLVSGDKVTLQVTIIVVYLYCGCVALMGRAARRRLSAGVAGRRA